MNFANIVKRIVNRLGFDIHRIYRSPSHTFMGLRDLQFGTVVDVGANSGQFARFAFRFFPHAEFYCFEPLEEPFRQLTKWAETQNDQVRCIRVALGAQEGEIEMHRHDNHSYSSSLLAATDTCHRLYPQTRVESMVRIPVSTLDAVFKDKLAHLPRPILLKLDVQGFEDRVLRGGEDFLSQCKAVILEVCIDPLYEGQAKFFDLAALLREKNLFYVGNLNQNYETNGRVVFLDAVFLR